MPDNGLSNRELNEMRQAVSSLFPEVCNFLSPTNTSDGQGGSDQAWGTVVRNQSCRVDVMSGFERLTDGSLRFMESLEFSFPYDTVIDTDWHIEFAGEQYHITGYDPAQTWAIERTATAEKLS